MLSRKMNHARPLRPRRPVARLATSLSVALLLPALGLAGLGGCQDQHHDQSVTVGTVELRRDIRVLEPIRNRDESNLLYVAVPVHNTSDKQLYVQGVMTFYDHYNNELNHVSRTITIPAGQTERFQGNSTGPQAESFHLSLNYPRVE